MVNDRVFPSFYTSVYDLGVKTCQGAVYTTSYSLIGSSSHSMNR